MLTSWVALLAISYPIRLDVSAFVSKFETYRQVYDVAPSCSIPGVYLLADLGDDEDNVIGYCEPWEDAFIIELDQTYWRHAPESERETLILHELGHCVLGRRHRDDYRVLGEGLVIESLMHSYENMGETYKRFQGHYLRELFDAHQ